MIAEPMRAARIGIVNRSDAARRFIQAAREYNSEHGTELTTIALHTSEERNASFVRAADETHLLGASSTVDPISGQRTSAYLNADQLGLALEEARLDAVWVGWGFASEQAWFADLCADRGVRFMGPAPEVLRRLGDKAAAKELAESLGIPVVPWSNGPVADLDGARIAANRIGYPLMLKALAGGGGRGIRIVGTEDDLAEQYASARNEARTSSGEPTFLLERQVRAARHLEVQIVADGRGVVWAVGVRDCTVQRRRQKVLEEAGVGAVEASLDADLRSWATQLVAAVGYEGVGTVEFLHDVETGATYFMEVNPRLQVEHTVTEATTGVDLVKLQLDQLLGLPLAGEAPAEGGFAIEARVTAEDPLDTFRPAPGLIVELQLPAGPGIRVDCGFQRGDRIPAEFDPLVAKIIVSGRSRPEALARLDRALAESRIVIDGGATTLGFLRSLVRSEAVAAGTMVVDTLDGVASELPRAPEGHAELAMLIGATELARLARRRAAVHLMSTAARGRPDLVGYGGQEFELGYRAVIHKLTVHRTDDDQFEIETPSGIVAVDVEVLGGSLRRVDVAQRTFDADILVTGSSLQVVLDGHSYSLRSDQAGLVRAPSPAVVVGFRVEAGQSVQKGDVLLVLESMKLELPVICPVDGAVRERLVTLNEQVDAGDPLMVVEPAGGSSGAGEALNFSTLIERSPGARSSGAGVANRRLRGFDSGPGFSVRSTSSGSPDTEMTEVSTDDPRTELDILRSFAEVCRLTGRRITPESNFPTRGLAAQEMLYAFMRAPERSRDALPPSFLTALEEALPRFGSSSLEPGDRLEEALYRLCVAEAAAPEIAPTIESMLRGWLRAGERVATELGSEVLGALEVLIVHAVDRFPAVSDVARATVHELFVQPALSASQRGRWPSVAAALTAITSAGADVGAAAAELASQPYDIGVALGAAGWPADDGEHSAALQVVLRQTYRGEELDDLQLHRHEVAGPYLSALRPVTGEIVVAAAPAQTKEIAALLDVLQDGDGNAGPPSVVELYLTSAGSLFEDARTLVEMSSTLPRLARVTLHVSAPNGPRMLSLAATPIVVDGQAIPAEVHPAAARRLELWRYRNFALEHVATTSRAHLLVATAHEHPDDRRLIVLAEVHDLSSVEAADGSEAVPELEATLMESVGMMRACQAERAELRDTGFNRIVLYVDSPWDVAPATMQQIAHRLAPASRNLGLDKMLARIRRVRSGQDETERLLHMTQPAQAGVSIGESSPSSAPVRPLTARQRRAMKLRRRGLYEPYEIIELLIAPEAQLSAFGRGEFAEYDLDADGRLVAVDRSFGENRAGVVVGLIRNATEHHPDAIERVVVVGDPSRGLGALAEPECRRIVAALDLAEERGIPVEWFAVSAGAQISMTSGTENMDWVARVLRRIVHFTQNGGEINILVTGVNVGAQPYFNAEATMLMHTRGILVMTAGSSMLLTGKEALDFAGGVSAEDNLGIGGYERIMGPNGQAQYWAPTLASACALLFRYYDFTYVRRGERFPRRTESADPITRDVLVAEHPDVDWTDFTSLREVFSQQGNPERKKPFDVRTLMSSLIDQDGGSLERWADMAGAEGSVVCDVRLGGWSTTLIGIEARSLPRRGVVPADGPSSWTGSTLFPRSSKKVARALNAASGNRPVVVLANLAGFDGSPESLRELQLEYGAEIGRAVTNFDGPIVFCVLSRYHGGAFVVFSRSLNPDLQVFAVEGSQASVIGGSAAAAVVFAREVERRVGEDDGVRRAHLAWERAEGTAKLQAEADLNQLRAEVRSGVRAVVAREFDEVHTVERARDVGSVERIIAADRLRPELIRAIERGISRYLERKPPDPADSPQLASENGGRAT